MGKTRRRLLLALGVLACLVSLYLCVPYFPFGGSIIARGSATERDIALTFDDGPNALWTPRILEILAKYDVKGPFFVV